MSDTQEPTQRVLVVDAANVVGSVPDGWWRDRAGAAARLQAALLRASAASELPCDEIVLVLEGQARGGVPEGSMRPASPALEPDRPCVRTVHAPASGDDEIVARCACLVGAGASVWVATADRGLIARVVPLGVEILGPRRIPRR